MAHIQPNGLTDPPWQRLSLWSTTFEFMIYLVWVYNLPIWPCDLPFLTLSSTKFFKSAIAAERSNFPNSAFWRVWVYDLPYLEGLSSLSTKTLHSAEWSVSWGNRMIYLVYPSDLPASLFGSSFCYWLAFHHLLLLCFSPLFLSFFCLLYVKVVMLSQQNHLPFWNWEWGRRKYSREEKQKKEK